MRRMDRPLEYPALVLGARLIDMEIRMSPARLPEVTAGPSWWDYFVGIKTHNTISPKWDFDFYGTVGTFADKLYKFPGKVSRVGPLP